MISFIDSELDQDPRHVFLAHISILNRLHVIMNRHMSADGPVQGAEFVHNLRVRLCVRQELVELQEIMARWGRYGRSFLSYAMTYGMI